MTICCFTAGFCCLELARAGSASTHGTSVLWHGRFTSSGGALTEGWPWAVLQSSTHVFCIQMYSVYPCIEKKSGRTLELVTSDRTSRLKTCNGMKEWTTERAHVLEPRGSHEINVISF